MKIFSLVFLLFLLLTNAPLAVAAKPRVRVSAPKNVTTTATGYSKAKLSRGTNSVVLTFMNLGSVSKVTYTLSYTANGIEQGAVGSLTSSGSSTDSRDIYFGTCSHGVCTPHRGIQNASLLVETQLKSGKMNVKRYKIRI